MDIDILIAKYLNRACTGDEQVMLDQWRASSPDHELKFRRSEEAWYLAKTITSVYPARKRKVWEKISERISRRYSSGYLIRVASIAASIALLVGWMLSYLLGGAGHTRQNQIQLITLSVPGGASSEIILPDSTKVWLNSSSTIRYPYIFSGENRTIELIGEAFFDVTPDADHPFVINSGKLEVKVLGTSFNFKHYPEDTHAILAVESGAVSVAGKGTSGNTTTLTAGKFATIETHTMKAKIHHTPYVNPEQDEEDKNHPKDMETPKVPEGYFSSWRANKLVFRDESFVNVLNDLSRRYNADFIVRDSEINDYIYTATFDNVTLEDILKLLKLSSPIDYSIKNLTSNTANAYGKREVVIYSK